MIYRNIPFREVDGICLHLDLIVPEQQAGPFPTIVWIHGGAFRYGDNSWYPEDLWLAESGFVIASINYRHSPPHVFPAAIEDCKAAVRWLRARCHQYSLDPQRIGVWGSSSGGHLASLVATSGETGVFEVGAHTEASNAVRAACSMCGSSDLTRLAMANGVVDGDDNALAAFLGGPVGQRSSMVVKANPITYISDSCPPFLLLHGTEDKAVPCEQSQLLHEALTGQGRDSTLHLLPGVGHHIDYNEIKHLVTIFFTRHLT